MNTLNFEGNDSQDARNRTYAESYPTMKKILVIYYSQTGQLTEIVQTVTSSLKADENILVDFGELKPRDPYPFPWSGKQFFQVFPESVAGIPCEMESLQIDPKEHYDLIILAYQVWYLSLSIPVNSFLLSEEAKKIMQGKPVVTIIGPRNMWVMTHEDVKEKISKAGGRNVGNIVLLDKAPNLISVVTIIRWLVKGKREGRGVWGKIFPRAGVSETDVRESSKYGPLLADALNRNDYQGLQQRLVELGAVVPDPVLISIEKRGRMMFKIWSKFILQKGPYGDPGRTPRLNMFKYYLFAVIYLVSPIGSIIFYLVHGMNRRRTKRMIRYYSGIT